MNILFLDDDPARIEQFTSMFPTAVVATMAGDCMHLLRTRKWDYVFLDHDLDGQVFVDPSETNTGSEVVRYLCSPLMLSRKDYVGTVVVHSMNHMQVGNMCSNLVDAGYVARLAAFGSDRFHLLARGVRDELLSNAAMVIANT